MQLMNALGAEMKKELPFSDESGIIYRFGLWQLLGVPDFGPSIYAFCYNDGVAWQVLYIGKAKRLRARISGHEKLQVARELGATHLAVYPMNALAEVGLDALEERLIKRYQPILNVRDNPSANPIVRALLQRRAK
ncbi:GIY-YIG nuclease family protein [Jannaschia ovalis]|uniref:GIY-YIG nuclease family protein n=1 Tax=Jannaschia ovalis TaxID=3038773 RepID=A0ABY8LBU0_9RHOB|nr:GIY-YIG nuclease family protein [Jannaschia sp. GRR-S6-38]WGH78756.1 GIY-YIG nuclease family protein [Jannaschia sp. GRR-S6-38]